MTDRESTWAATLAKPECDTTRLVHADAVQEAGDDELAALIRVGVPCGCVYLKDGQVFANKMECGPCEGKHWLHRCEHEGCRAAGRLCVLEGVARDPGPNDPDIEEWLCGEHAVIHGYCPVCGSFWGGISSFEVNGICDHCRDQFDADYEEEREFEDEHQDNFYGDDFEP